MTLAILALALAVAVPAFDRLAPGFALRATVRDTAATLREARSLAIARNREVAVVVDVDARTVGIEASDRMAAVDERLGLSLYSAAEELIDRGAGRIRFYPDGTSTGGRVSFSLGDRRNEVTVSWITGMVAIRD